MLLSLSFLRNGASLAVVAWAGFSGAAFAEPVVVVGGWGSSAYQYAHTDPAAARPQGSAPAAKVQAPSGPVPGWGASMYQYSYNDPNDYNRQSPAAKAAAAGANAPATRPAPAK